LLPGALFEPDACSGDGGCSFQIDFYGYDEGDLEAQVTFEAHPPTQRAGDDQVLLTDSVFIGEDDNSGGGSQAGLDASVADTLDLTGIEPHPVQGFHVKLTVNAEGSQGADVKHKVFWVTGCGPSPITTTTSGTTSTTGATTTTVAVGGSSSSAAGAPPRACNARGRPRAPSLATSDPGREMDGPGVPPAPGPSCRSRGRVQLRAP
jgi:hypothetical protein